MVYYKRIVDGKLFRRSCKTADWDEAAAVRDLHESKGQVEPQTFAEFAARHLAEDMGGLAATTQTDRRRYLAHDGPILPVLGSYRLDEITRPLASRYSSWKSGFSRSQA